MPALEALQLDNQSLRCLPLDESGDRGSRPVRNACFSLVTPEPLKNPQLVSISIEALSMLLDDPDVAANEVSRPEFVAYVSGNRLLPGSQPAAHCYAGHQFGFFSGQLGDGAAIYLGEVVNARGQRWEMQLKGAGQTPYSRAGDGRKVLRSSLREFLCSEAMYHLGIPTTRAAALVTSDSRVERDPYYDGNVLQERCSVVLRIAPTFLRFGSFEIFKAKDAFTGREGPSCGLEHDMLPRMLNFTIKSYFPDIWAAHKGDELMQSSNVRAVQDMYFEFYKEVVCRTASLVAGWQSVGFTHGVLNTDNMSVLGLTIDYGPFGFMERFDPEFVPNGSDDAGRYDYQDQSEICRWNCERLGEAIASALPVRISKEALALYDEEYARAYIALMRRKLGLLVLEHDSDSVLVSDLLTVMKTCGSDFSNTFRGLANFPMPRTGPADVELAGTSEAPADGNKDDSSAGHNHTGAAASPAGALNPNEGLRHDDGGVLEAMVSGRASLSELVRMAWPRMPAHQLQMLQMLQHRDPALLQAMGTSPQEIMRDLDRLKQAEALRGLSEESKLSKDRAAWAAWLNRYGDRLQQEAHAGASAERRVQVMNSVNPRFVLRNWLAQHAIDKADAGGYREVNRLLELLKTPFADGDHDDLVRAADSRIHPLFKEQGPSEQGPSASGQEPPISIRYDGLAPASMACTRVTCSS